MSKFNILFILALLTVDLAYAVGISGSDLDVETTFAPDGRFEFSFTGIANKEYDGLGYTAFADGDLAPYITLTPSSWADVPRGAYLPFSGVIVFPSSLPPPSAYSKICFMEECPGQGTVCGRTASCASIYVKIPYSGSHPAISLVSPDVNENQMLPLKVTVTNNGDSDIGSCSGSVSVFGMDKTLIGTVQLSGVSVIASFASATMQADFDTSGVLSGNYSATATVNCDSADFTANSSFRIGTLYVKIVKYPADIENGGIKKFTTTVESVWNDPVEIYAKINIYDINTSIDAKTANYRLEPWKQLDLDAFVDTSSLQEKGYNLKIEAFYSGKSTVAEDKIDIIAAPPSSVAVPVKEEPKGMSMTALTIILVIVVLLLTVVNIVLVMYRKKKE